VKTVVCVFAAFLIIFISEIPSAWSQTTEVVGYTIVTTNEGPQICLGTWVPPANVAQPGFCQGQMLDVFQLTAVSARKSADELNELLIVLTSIAEKLDVNNKQVEQLIKITASLAPIVQLDSERKKSLHEAITQRFDALPKDVLTNDLFKKELIKLREDILSKVDDLYSTRPAP